MFKKILTYTVPGALLIIAVVAVGAYSLVSQRIVIDSSEQTASILDPGGLVKFGTDTAGGVINFGTDMAKGLVNFGTDTAKGLVNFGTDGAKFAIDPFHKKANDVKDKNDGQDKLAKARAEILQLRLACGSKCDFVSYTQGGFSKISADGKTYSMSIPQIDGSVFACLSGDRLDQTKISTNKCSGTGCVPGIIIYGTSDKDVLSATVKTNSNGAPIGATLMEGSKLSSQDWIDATVYCKKAGVQNLPDIALVSVSTPTEIAPTSAKIDITINYTITGVATTTDFSIAYQLSKSGVWGEAENIKLYDRNVISSSSEKTLGTHVKIYSQVIAGNINTAISGGRYFILARINNAHFNGGVGVIESSYDNNTAVGNKIKLVGDGSSSNPAANGTSLTGSAANPAAAAPAPVLDPIVTPFTANPTTVTSGGSVKFRWTAQHVGSGSCNLNYADSGVNIHTWDPRIQSGDFNLTNVDQTRSYKLRCNKTVDGKVYTGFSVLTIIVEGIAPAANINPAPAAPVPVLDPIVTSFTARRANLATAAIITWTAQHVGSGSCNLNYADSGVNIHTWATGIQGETFKLTNISQTRSYKLRCNKTVDGKVYTGFRVLTINANGTNLTSSVLGALDQVDQSDGSSVVGATDNSSATQNITSCLSLTNNIQYHDNDTLNTGVISLLQGFLQSSGYLSSSPTGYFGDQTFQAVKTFQDANGIESTGYVGELTRAKIQEMSCR